MDKNPRLREIFLAPQESRGESIEMEIAPTTIAG
jgi:hypothetical protein